MIQNFRLTKVESQEKFYNIFSINTGKLFATYDAQDEGFSLLNNYISEDEMKQLLELVKNL